MTIRYVAPSGGSDTGGSSGGTAGSPYATGAYGTTYTLAGDVLEFLEGTHTTGAVIDTQVYTVNGGTSWANAVTFRGTAGKVVTLAPNGSAIRLTTAVAYHIFQNLTFDGVNYSGTDEGCIAYNSGHLRIQNCIFKRWRVFAVHLFCPFVEFLDNEIFDTGYSGDIATNGHAIYHTGNDGIFRDNHIHDNSGYGIHCYGNILVPHTSPSRNVIERNHIHDCGYHSSSEYGIIFSWGSDNTVRNNIVTDCDGGIKVYTDSANGRVLNNTITRCGPDPAIAMQYYLNPPVIRNNLIYGNAVGIVDQGESTGLIIPTIDHNLDTNPGWVNSTPHNPDDFKLLDTSDAIDAGIDLADVLDDYDGVARVNGFYDIGAFENLGTDPPETTTTTISNNTGSDATGVDDTQISELNATTNYGSDARIAATKYQSGNHYSSLISFSGLTSIPTSAIVTAVTVRLWLAASSSAGGTNIISLKRLLRTFTPTGATWNKYDGASNWSTPGALNALDSIATLSASATVPEVTGVYYEFTGSLLISDVQNIINRSVTNRGWLLERTDAADDFRYRSFSSSEDTDGHRPEIEVTWYSEDSVGICAATSTATAVGQSSIVSTAGSSTGAATVTAVGRSVALAVGTVICTSTATGATFPYGVGAAAGVATASAVGQSGSASVGTVACHSTAVARSNTFGQTSSVLNPALSGWPRRM